MNRIELSSGREVSVVELRQSLFYEGLIEGLPTREHNAAWLRALLADIAKEHRGARPLVVPPVERPLEWASPEEVRLGRRYPFGTPAAWPPVVCQMRLKSRQAGDPLHYSELIVVWFQMEFAFPIEPSQLEAIRSADWESVAQVHEV
jgi:hypothetical protein